MRKADKRVYDVVINHIEATKEKIKVLPGECRYNFRCSFNAVHDAIEHNHDRVAMCMYIDEGYAILHFITVDNNGVFIDNTIGHWSKNIEYYLIKYIDKEDFFSINNLFDTYSIELFRVVPFWKKLLSSIDKF